MERVWPGQTVEEGNLTVQIAALRKAMGTDAEGRDWILTVPREGYRLTGWNTESAPPPSLPVLPSLAVLPFQNLSGDTEQDYFASGVVEDIITALSRFKSFVVVRQMQAGQARATNSPAACGGRATGCGSTRSWLRAPPERSFGRRILMGQQLIFSIFRIGSQRAPPVSLSPVSGLRKQTAPGANGLKAWRPMISICRRWPKSSRSPKAAMPRRTGC